MANGAAAQLLYGDRSAGRGVAVKLWKTLGVPLESWDEPCPVTVREHVLPAESGVLPGDDADTEDTQAESA